MTHYNINIFIDFRCITAYPLLDYQLRLDQRGLMYHLGLLYCLLQFSLIFFALFCCPATINIEILTCNIF